MMDSDNRFNTQQKNKRQSEAFIPSRRKHTVAHADAESDTYTARFQGEDPPAKAYFAADSAHPHSSMRNPKSYALVGSFMICRVLAKFDDRQRVLKSAPSISIPTRYPLPLQCAGALSAAAAAHGGYPLLLGRWQFER